MNMPNTGGSKILSFEEFCTANLGGLTQATPASNQEPTDMPTEPEMPQGDQGQTDQDDLTLLDGPETEPAEPAAPETEAEPTTEEPAK